LNNLYLQLITFQPLLKIKIYLLFSLTKPIVTKFIREVDFSLPEKFQKPKLSWILIEQLILPVLILPMQPALYLLMKTISPFALRQEKRSTLAPTI